MVDGVEHAIADTVRGIIDEDLRGLKVAGKSFEDFNHNYGLTIESRKLLKSAIGKTQISALNEKILGGLVGYLIGGATGIGAPVGGTLGAVAGKSLFESLPITGIKSVVSAGARIVGDVRLPRAVGKAKAPLTGVERITASQTQSPSQ